jgi:low affinity Fe/Cu permease
MMNNVFHQLAERTSAAVGSPLGFVAALVVVVLWVASGPLFGFSDTWQLVINTGTTVVTFLIVFLIQRTQNRGNEAIQLKLDELIRAVEGARTGLVDLESLTDEELNRLKKQFERIREREAVSAPQTDQPVQPAA